MPFVFEDPVLKRLRGSVASLRVLDRIPDRRTELDDQASGIVNAAMPRRRRAGATCSRACDRAGRSNSRSSTSDARSQTAATGSRLSTWRVNA